MTKLFQSPWYILATVSFLTIIGMFGISTYIKIQEHDLNVTNGLAACVKNFGGDTENICADFYKGFFIFKRLSSQK